MSKDFDNFNTCGILGKTIIFTWETLCKTEVILEKNAIFHKTIEEGVEYWIEAKAITMRMADNLYCVSWEDKEGNSFTLILDTLSMEAKATLTYEDGIGNSKPQHTVGKFKFIN